MIKKRLLCILFTVCMIIQLLPISMIAQGDGSANNPIIVYRNPVLDPAGDSLPKVSLTAEGIGSLLAAITDFSVRNDVVATWVAQISNAANISGNDLDVYYYVQTANMGYSSITKQHIVHILLVLVFLYLLY